MRNELKNRGVREIFVLCADGLSGVEEVIAAAFPMAGYRQCIVHVVRNTLKYVSDKDKKAFAKDLRAIYRAPDAQSGHARLEVVAEVWNKIRSILISTISSVFRSKTVSRRLNSAARPCKRFFSTTGLLFFRPPFRVQSILLRSPLD